MSVSNRNTLSMLADWRLLFFLAIAVCLGCQARLSQLQVDPNVEDDSVAAVEPAQSAPLIAKANKASDSIDKPSTDDSTTALIQESQTSTAPIVDVPDPPPLEPDNQPSTAPLTTIQESELPGQASDQQAQNSELKNPLEQPPRVVAKKPPIVERNGKIYQPYHLNKNQTLLLLAAQPDIRSRILASTVREVTTPEQQLAAEQLAATFDQQYVEILRQRAALLESAVDGIDVEAQLLDLRMTTADLTGRVRTKINLEILTQDQRFELQRLFEESQE